MDASHNARVSGVSGLPQGDSSMLHRTDRVDPSQYEVRIEESGGTSASSPVLAPAPSTSTPATVTLPPLASTSTVAPASANLNTCPLDISGCGGDETKERDSERLV